MRMRRPHPPLIPAVAVVVAIIPCWLLIIVTAATTTTTGSGHSKGPLRDGEGSVKDDIKDFKFTQPSYNATVPENSLGSTLILPYTGEQIFTGGKVSWRFFFKIYVRKMCQFFEKKLSESFIIIYRSPTKNGRVEPYQTTRPLQHNIRRYLFHVPV